MAPELLRAQPADARSDVWALGVVLYEMAVGRLPFEGKTGFELGAAILHLPTPSLPDHLPLSLQGIIRRSLAKNAGERYAHAGAAAAAIEAVRMEFSAGWSDQNPRPRTSSTVPSAGNLPLSRTSFVGRVEELARLARELESNRLVTLTGVGGSGKTRLALRIAEQSRSDFRDGVWWVDLAPLADDRRVEEAVASTFGILNSQRSPRESAPGIPGRAPASAGARQLRASVVCDCGSGRCDPGDVRRRPCPGYQPRRVGRDRRADARRSVSVDSRGDSGNGSRRRRRLRRCPPVRLARCGCSARLHDHPGQRIHRPRHLPAP